VGLLLLGGGNIGVVYGESYIDSGVAALLIAIMPLYVALINLLLPHAERLKARGWFGLALGFIGLIALLWPTMHLTGAHGQMIGTVVVLGAALSWGAGSVLSRELKLPVNPIVAAGWQMFAAGLACAIGATLLHEWPQAHWNRSSIGAVAYLVTFGSLIGYVSFVWLLHHVPVSKVSTYAYVNPVVAVILGALLLKERLVGSEYIGMAAIIIAVALVTSSGLTKQATSEEKQPKPEECKV
jgi:drug/metabolite transporter (DMT)-like permease